MFTFDYIFVPQPWLRAFHIAFFGFAILGSLYVHHLTWDLFRPLGYVRLRQVKIIHRAMWGFLASIWITGGVLIWLAPKDLLSVPKVQLKLAVVGTLTVIAFLMGRFVIHRMHSHFALGKEPWRYQVLAVVLGCISMTSWTFPFLLGLGREWNDRAKFWELLVVYLVLLGAAMASGLVFHTWHYQHVKRNRVEPDTRPMELDLPVAQQIAVPAPTAEPATRPAPARSRQKGRYHRRVLPVPGYDPRDVELEKLAYRDTSAGEV